MLVSSFLSKFKLQQTCDLSATLSTVLSSSASVPHAATQCRRGFKSELKIKWVRPTKIPSILPAKSGDLRPLPSLDPSTIHEDFVDSSALKELSAEQKKLYTLGFLPHRKTTEMFRNQAVSLVQRHKIDSGSMECQIAIMTVKIRGMQLHAQNIPKDIRSKVALKELIERRKKFLKYLRRWDYKRFEWLLEKLDIVYHPPPEEFHWVTRKDSLCKLTQEHCDNIKKTRLAAYKEQLDVEKELFLKEKAEILKWIAEEERACGVVPPESASSEQAPQQA